MVGGTTRGHTNETDTNAHGTVHWNNESNSMNPVFNKQIHQVWGTPDGSKLHDNSLVYWSEWTPTKISIGVNEFIYNESRGKVQIWNPQHLSTFSAPQHLLSTSAPFQHLSTFSVPQHLFSTSAPSSVIWYLEPALTPLVLIQIIIFSNEIFKTLVKMVYFI
jgi:hypothetical protein